LTTSECAIRVAPTGTIRAVAKRHAIGVREVSGLQGDIASRVGEGLDNDILGERRDHGHLSAASESSGAIERGSAGETDVTGAGTLVVRGGLNTDGLRVVAAAVEIALINIGTASDSTVANQFGGANEASVASTLTNVDGGVNGADGIGVAVAAQSDALVNINTAAKCRVSNQSGSSDVSSGTIAGTLIESQALRASSTGAVTAAVKEAFVSVNAATE